jgi:hypothetical protein
MKNEEEVPVIIEYIDPNEFVDHPLKKELQLSPEEKPKKALEAMDNAWKQLPDQVAPVIYTLCFIDGIEKKAILDGSGRVTKAKENNVRLIAAIRVTVDNNDRKKVFEKILAPNTTFHISLFEIGKAAAILFKEYSPGQGSQNAPQKGIDTDGIIAGKLGYGLRSSRVKKSRLVYEANPDLLRQVDNKELKSLAAAYNTIKKKKVSNSKRHSDGDEVEIGGNNTEGLTYSNEISSNKPVEPIEIDAKNINASESVDWKKPAGGLATDAIPEDLTEKKSAADTTAGEIPTVTIKLSLNGQSIRMTCPCCSNQIMVKTI